MDHKFSIGLRSELLGGQLCQKRAGRKGRMHRLHSYRKGLEPEHLPTSPSQQQYQQYTPSHSASHSAKWVFNHKLGPDGAIERYKCRLVAKGFRQRPGQDFLDVYAPVTARSTVRVLLAAAVHKKMYLRQLDIKTAFLNGVIEEDVYMEQPEGFECGDKSMVCKLQRAIYGLKQAPRAWHNTLKKVLMRIGFRPCRADPALFARRESDGTWSYINTYVDDFLIAVLRLGIYEEILQAMRSAKWEVKELGISTQYLSLDMEVEVDSDGRCVRINYVQEVFADKHLLIEYVPSCDQLADPHTKALGRTILESCLPRTGMVQHG